MGEPLPREDAGAQIRQIVIGMRRRPWLTALLLIPIALLGTLLLMFVNARAMPVVRRMDVLLPFPANVPQKAVTVALLTDSHMSGPDNSPARMARIVAQINGLKPDLILLGGDYIGDDKGGTTYDAVASIAPFSGLRAPLGIIAVLGNHDNRSKKNRTALSRPDWHAAFARIGVTMLDNDAVRRGPLAIGGLRDVYTGKPDIPGTLSAMRALGGASVMMSHGPDVFPDLPDAASLTLVGHTHCGQVALPFAGIVYVPSKYGTRYACGLYRSGEKTMIVSAGVGTSGLPLRLLSPPDIWLVTVRPR
jgi:predicted MPP superfamily phosphohydrolase